MSPEQNGRFLLSRRNILLAGAAALGGCGGGGSSSVAGAPGTGGTGIGMQGAITGFGSVIINNAKLDDSAAVVRIDGAAAHTTDLRIGMVANVIASRDGLAASGRASRIDVWSIAMGAVTRINAANSFDVAGLTVLTDAATSFENAANVAAIATGMQVAVWGMQSGASASVWKATRVSVQASNTATVTTGLVSVVGPIVTLNGFTLTGAAASAVRDQQLVRATGTLNTSTGVLALSAINMIGLDASAEGISSLEVQGVVTAWTDAWHFSMGEVIVDATKAAAMAAGQSVSLGMQVQVNGAVRNGVLIASRIEIKDASTLGQMDITGLVESQHFQGISEFVVRGQECDASTANIRSGLPSNLAVGVKVRLLGVASGDEMLQVTDLYIGVP